MSILNLNYVGSLADGTQVPRQTVLDRLFTALYRARMAQAERVIAQYCPIVAERVRRPDPADRRSFPRD
ncbi:hypothetical protein PQJ75_21280 [Rhodoplanes sp. TEM]|uniref:Uncharacterized protein n=1 Tax=Rhodoplanes tepidamans TaxID=200616 RepID=A0ABT5J8F7_RHOTP|nr:MULTISPECIES: hypothetical protein [Rhodoplanes]MDC7785330.1 hypothetical protein [Rhodoplanes tepidamans]MDC7986269.1 hypothetical protein [Rhodoplanes sp. TEM]MDQ0353219.1 hypothetical protein [Rhodoplanes tepidamans]